MVLSKGPGLKHPSSTELKWDFRARSKAHTLINTQEEITARSG